MTVQPRLEREDHHEELREVRERRLEHAGDGQTSPAPDLLDRDPTTHATPASASVANTNATIRETPLA